jgi:hypothetical protein
MQSSRNIRGAGVISVVLIAGALMAGITLTLKLGPHYIDWRTMDSVFEGLHRQPIQDMSPSAIREAVAKGFRVNGLRDFDLRKILTITEGKDGTTLAVAYEQREHIMFNVDVVLTFAGTYKYP